MGFLCDVLKKLRYVFIAMAYLYSAILVFKTVNSLKG
ncbi:TPA: virulence factor TspB C-terminal domain-related protein [Neisseria meningitidis]|nr:virulence factor TspB C-terminal domain-related protein [Neisseria meningitidis]